MSDFEYVSLSNLVEEIIDNRGRTCPTSEQGIPLIATNCIKEDRIYPTHEKVRYVSDETYREWFRGHPIPGDILFVNKGSPGRVCLVPDPIDFCIAQDMVALRANRRLVCPQYLFAALRSPQVKASIDNMHVGTMIPHFKKGDFDKLLIPVPDRGKQEGIGDIYCSFSLAIENKRKTNETLEAMAKALFKSWFVDFDPVRAKAEGRPTGLPAEISDLFPDSFEDSELGEIPSGWSVSNLADFIHLDSGLPYKGLQKGTGDAHLLTMGCADRALRFKSDGVHSYPSPIPARHLVNPGDIVICSHDLTQAREQLGAPFVVPDNFSGRIVAAATNTFIVRQKSPSTTEYLYQIFRSNGFREQMIASAKGSVILHISKESVLYYSFASPGSDRLISAYQSATDGMTQKIQEIGKCIYTLTTIRDALLPKLISGEIRIPDAEKMLEEVGA